VEINCESKTVLGFQEKVPAVEEALYLIEDPGVDGRIILKRIFEWLDWGGGMDWLSLAQDRDRWRALVNAVMNLRVP
jgi:hypothetical protein